ncbi:hypothetical protein EVA_18720 [gut metagenome]|uniref:Uncharacterized protein n=1 Tax=gut metagenome TaxID=749906 RepID=J9FUC8_9ZZZZ
MQPNSPTILKVCFPKTVAVVRTYKVTRSGALQVLSMATDWSFHSLPKPISRALLGVTDTEQTGWRIFPKGRHFRHRMKYDKSEVVANISELTSKTIRWLYFCKRQPAFGRAIVQIIV